MRIYMFGVVLLLLSILYLPTVAMAQAELKTPNCVDPQEPMERMCCNQPTPQVCQTFGYKAPGQDQDTSATAIPPLNEVELLAPWDATIGMQLSALDTQLKARGLRRSSCEWSSYRAEDVHVKVGVSLVSAAGTPVLSCVQDLPVHTIGFQQREGREAVFSKLPLPAEMAATWIKRFGDPITDCRQYQKPGGSYARCSFENVSADIKRLTLQYDHNNSQINRFVVFSAEIVGFDRNETVVEEKAKVASEDTRSAEAVLESQMSIPMGRPLICQSIRNTMKYGNDYIIEGVTIVDKGQLLTDMPEACKN